MENQKTQIYCRFVAVFDSILILILSGIESFLLGVWLGFEIFLFIPTGAYVAVTLLAGIVMILLCAGVNIAVMYGAVLLWDMKQRGYKRYLTYQVLYLVMAVAVIALGIVFILYGLFHLLVNICFVGLFTTIAILNAVGFYLKRKELKQETEKDEIHNYQQSEKIKREVKDKGNHEGEKEHLPGGKILGLSGEYAGVVFPMRPKEKIFFGKNPEHCQILLSDPHISRIHCSVCYREDLKIYEVTDYSKNGTFLEDGERLPRQIICQCQPGTIFTMEHEKQVFQLL